MKDSTTKERYFTTPMSLTAGRGGSQSSAQMNYSSHSEQQVYFTQQGDVQSAKGGRALKVLKGKVKGKGKGKGKGGRGNGKGKGGGKGSNQTPDGRAICFDYNNGDIRCKRAQCKFLHVCTVCFQRHPAYQCKGLAGAPAGSETQGAGQPSA